jgi:Fe-S cluster biogenesis protein NfuA
MHATMNDDLRSRVEVILRGEIAREFELDGGAMEVLDVTDGVARVRLGAACTSCPASLMMLIPQMEAALHARVPEVEFLEAIA